MLLFKTYILIGLYCQGWVLYEILSTTWGGGYRASYMRAAGKARSDMLLKLGALSVLVFSVGGFVGPWTPVAKTSRGNLRPLWAFGSNDDESEPIAVSIKSPEVDTPYSSASNDALRWNDAPLVITPNFDKSKSSLDALLARAQERARNDADIISSRARADLEFLQELDRAAR